MSGSGAPANTPLADVLQFQTDAEIFDTWLHAAVGTLVDFSGGAGTDMRPSLATFLSGIAGGPVTTQAGTAYTIASGDQSSTVLFTNGAAITATLPKNLAVGFTVLLLQDGAGAVTAVAQSGGSIVTPNSAVTGGEYGCLLCRVIANGSGNAAQWWVIALPGSGTFTPPSTLYTYNTDTNFNGPASPHAGSVFGTLTVAPANAGLLDLHIGMGGGWDFGANNAAFDAPFTTAPLDGANCLMPAQGPYPVGPSGSVNITSLVDLYEKPTGSALETWCSRAGHAIQNGFAAAGITGPTLAFVISGRDSSSYQGLKRGTPTYTQMLGYVSNIKSVAAGMGLTVRVRSFVTMDGTLDVRTPRDEYANDMMAWRRDFEADVKAITGQTEAIVLVLLQRNQAVTGMDPTTSFANIDAMDIDPAHCIVSHPSYSIGPTDNATGANGGSHWMAMASVQNAEQLGHALLKHIYGSGHKPVRLLRGAPGAYWSAKSPYTITLTYSKPVLIDTSNAVVDNTQLTNYGFSFSDQSGSPPNITGVTQAAALSNITVAGANVTFNSFPATTEAVIIVYNGVAYGMDVNASLTTASIAAGFAAAIAGASAAGSVLTLPGAPTSVTAYSATLTITLSGEPLGASVLRYACNAAQTYGNQAGSRGVVRGPSAFASSAISSGLFSFGANPAVNDTVTVNGTVVTFVASGASGNQVNIGANAAGTASALYTMLQASSNANLQACRYTLNAAGTGVLVYAANGVTIAKSSANITLTQMAPIPLYDWALSQRVDLPPI